jgi:uncharacterized protein (DUF427 family)
MSLTMGRAPFARPPGGQFNFACALPERVLYFEDSGRRVRVLFNGHTVADSRRVKLLHETGQIPVYCFPEADVRTDLLRPSEHMDRSLHKGVESRWSLVVGDRIADAAAWSYPDPPESARFLRGFYAFEWDRMDAWYEEDEQVFVHARDPYHRVDVRNSSRHVRVLIDGELVAETRRPRLVFETGLPTRYYIPREDVRVDQLEHSDRHTGCPYKGTASYCSVRTSRRLVRDVVWYYPEPLAEAVQIRNLLAFYNERVVLEVDEQPAGGA